MYIHPFASINGRWLSIINSYGGENGRSERAHDQRVRPVDD
jgi:hypothetical protein